MIYFNLFNLISREFIEQIQKMIDAGENGDALYRTDMMVTSLKEEGNDWAKFRVPICGLLFGAFQLRASEYDTTVVKANAKKEIKTFQSSPCLKVNDIGFVEALGDDKKDAILTAKDAFVCLTFPARCEKLTAKLVKDKGESAIGINREPRKGRKKRENEVVEVACFEDDEILPPEVDEDEVII